jgi:hypothetical protein
MSGGISVNQEPTTTQVDCALLGTCDFHQRVARLNHSASGGEMRGEDLLQSCLAGIATGELAVGISHTGPNVVGF